MGLCIFPNFYKLPLDNYRLPRTNNYCGQFFDFIVMILLANARYGENIIELTWWLLWVDLSQTHIIINVSKQYVRAAPSGLPDGNLAVQAGTSDDQIWCFQHQTGHSYKRVLSADKACFIISMQGR